MKIEENNKLIAEFLNLNCALNSEGMKVYEIDPDNWFPTTDLRYHESWDWLMPVVEKCTKVGYANAVDFEDEIYLKWEECFGDNLAGGFLGNHIDEVYGAVIKFINWYSEQK